MTFNIVSVRCVTAVYSTHSHRFPCLSCFYVLILNIVLPFEVFRNVYAELLSNPTAPTRLNECRSTT